MGSQFESQFWASVDNATDPALYEAYLARYPNGTFADLARIKMLKLKANAVQPQAAPPAPAVVAAPPAAPSSPGFAPPVAAPDARSQGSPGQTPPGQTVPVALPATDGPSLQSPARITNAAVQAAPEPAMRSSSPLAHRPAADDGSGAPYVTKAVPADGEADDSKLNNLLDAIRGPAQPPATVPSPSTPLPPPAPGPAPTQAVSYPSPAPNSYGPAPVTPAPTSGAAYGTPASDPGNQRPIAVGILPAGFALPPRPILMPVPSLNFPESFCSADTRNAFHNNVYRSAVEAATRNYDLTGAYLRELQDIYDRYNLSGSTEPQNAVAAEARAYKQISDQAFFTQSALVNAFKALMAVPIIPCEQQR